MIARFAQIAARKRRPPPEANDQTLINGAQNQSASSDAKNHLEQVPAQASNGPQHSPSEQTTIGSQPSQTSEPKTPFYKKTWFCVLLTFIIPPVGIALMWVFKKPKGKTPRIVLTVVAALLILVGISGGAGGSSNAQAANKPTTQTSTAEQNAVKEIDSITATYTGKTDAGTEVSTGSSGITVTANYTDGSTEKVSGWSIETPITLTAGTTSECTVEYKGKTCSISITCSTPDEATYKASCQSIAYDDLARNPDNYKGKNVKFTGKVVQVIEDNSGSTYRINVTKGKYSSWDDTVLVAYSPSSSSNRILEDDIVTFYGLSGGLYTYKSTMGASITIPSVYAKYIDLN